MKLQLFQVDAFTDELFKGNPAAVCPLDKWLPPGTMQNIALENNLSETAFYIKEDEGFALRWFTPSTEVDLCGHATLAAAHVIFTQKKYESSTISFSTKSGELTVAKKDNGLLAMNFPAVSVKPEAPPLDLYHGVNGEIADEVYRADDFMMVFDKEEKIRNIIPHFELLSKIDARGIIVTAPGNNVDFVSRFFAPSVGVNEDPVTGSAHTELIPYWAERLNKDELTAAQVSPRSGKLYCKMPDDDRVEIAGRACTYLEGTIKITG